MVTASDPRRSLESIRAQSPGLRPAEAKVAALILADPNALIAMSVSQVAAAAEVSEASVVRCCQALGFRGFHELKLEIARSTALRDREILGDIERTDTTAMVLSKVLRSSADALAQAAPAIDVSSLEAGVAAISSARRVLIAGVGTSAPVAADAAYRFATIGIDVSAPADVHAQHVAAGLLRSGDASLIVSHTGSTIEPLTVARTAREAGAATISLTSFRPSPLTELVDYAIVAGSRETAFRVEAMASRLVHVAVVDVMFVMLAMRREPSSTQTLDKVAQILSEHRV